MVVVVLRLVLGLGLGLLLKPKLVTPTPKGLTNSSSLSTNRQTRPFRRAFLLTMVLVLVLVAPESKSLPSGLDTGLGGKLSIGEGVETEEIRPCVATSY